jgi:hypothetical protein
MNAVHFFEMLGCDYTMMQVSAEEHNAKHEAVQNLGLISAIIYLFG